MVTHIYGWASTCRRPNGTRICSCHLRTFLQTSCNSHDTHRVWLDRTRAHPSPTWSGLSKYYGSEKRNTIGGEPVMVTRLQRLTRRHCASHQVGTHQDCCANRDPLSGPFSSSRGTTVASRTSLISDDTAACSLVPYLNIWEATCSLLLLPPSRTCQVASPEASPSLERLTSCNRTSQPRLSIAQFFLCHFFY